MVQNSVQASCLIGEHDEKNLSAADVVPPRPLMSAASVRKQTDICRLRVVSRLPAHSLCESVLFGNVWTLLLAICRPSGCTVASGIVGVVVGGICNRSQMRTSKHTCLIFGVSIGLDPD